MPYSVAHTVLNYIGGDPWTHAGEWIEWEFEVPEDGYYHISIKGRQMYQRGALSARTVFIDGEVPFEDLEAVTFGYSTGWEMRTLGDAEGNPFRFYLTAGKHTIRMEVTLGQMGPVLKRVEDSIYRLNQIYRKLLVLTGANPDRFRDYNLAKIYPEAIEAMDLESKRLYKIVDDVVATTGEKSDRVAAAQALAVQLEQFVENNDRITESFVNFKDNITALGTAMQNMSESKLDVDLIMITGENAKVPAVSENIFQSLIHEIRSCASLLLCGLQHPGRQVRRDGRRAGFVDHHRPGSEHRAEDHGGRQLHHGHGDQGQREAGAGGRHPDGGGGRERAGHRAERQRLVRRELCHAQRGGGSEPVPGL